MGSWVGVKSLLGAAMHAALGSWAMDECGEAKWIAQGSRLFKSSLETSIMRGFAVVVLLLGLAARLPNVSAALRNACDDAMDLTDDGMCVR